VPGRAFVDCHSHVCPSGDDGAASVAEGAFLCDDAARAGTRLLFATPHVFPHLQLTGEREAQIRASLAELRATVGLELRLGFELTPSEHLLDEDLRRYELEGTGCALLEVPFDGPLGLFWRVGEALEAAGLRPVAAHPERTESVLAEPALAGEIAGRGWLLQVNTTSLLGRHGPRSAALGWELIGEGVATIVASDGHRQARPARLDEAYELAKTRLGENARALFDGTALGLASAKPIPSRAATPGA